MVIALKVSDRHLLLKTGVVLPFLTAVLHLKISLMEIPLSGCLSEASGFALQLEEKVCPTVWEAKKKQIGKRGICILFGWFPQVGKEMTEDETEV